MFELFSKLLQGLSNVLPDSFVQSTLNGLDKADLALGYLNFFIPFDIALKMLLAWIPLMMLFYTFSNLRNAIFKLLN